MITIKNSGWDQALIREALVNEEEVFISRIIGYARGATKETNPFEGYRNYTKFTGWFLLCTSVRSKTGTTLVLPGNEDEQLLELLDGNKRTGVEFVLDIRAVKDDNCGIGFRYDAEWLVGTESPNRLLRLVNEYAINTNKKGTLK